MGIQAKEKRQDEGAVMRARLFSAARLRVPWDLARTDRSLYVRHCTLVLVKLANVSLY